MRDGSQACMHISKSQPKRSYNHASFHHSVAITDTCSSLWSKEVAGAWVWPFRSRLHTCVKDRHPATQTRTRMSNNDDTQLTGEHTNSSLQHMQ